MMRISAERSPGPGLIPDGVTVNVPSPEPDAGTTEKPEPRILAVQSESAVTRRVFAPVSSASHLKASLSVVTEYTLPRRMTVTVADLSDPSQWNSTPSTQSSSVGLTRNGVRVTRVVPKPVAPLSLSHPPISRLSHTHVPSVVTRTSCGDMSSADHSTTVG